MAKKNIKAAPAAGKTPYVPPAAEQTPEERLAAAAAGLGGGGERPGSAADLAAAWDVPVRIAAVLGETSMPVSDLLGLGRGAVLELDRRIGEAVDILVNDRLVARGEVVVVEDRLGVTLTEIVKAGR